MGSFRARGATTRDAVRAGGANAAVELHTANTANAARAICLLSLTDLGTRVSAARASAIFAESAQLVEIVARLEAREQ